MKLRMFGAAVAAAAICASAQAGAKTILIDDFAANPRQVVQDEEFNGISNFAEREAAGAIGGFRDLEAINGSNVVGGTELIADGSLKFNNGVASIGVGKVTYDGDDDNRAVDTDGLNLDLQTDFGPNAFFNFDVASADANLMVSLTLFQSTAPGETEISSTVFRTIPENQGRSYKIFLSEFSGIDLSNIGAIQYTLDAQDAALDAQINSIQVSNVPVPPSVALMASAFAGLGLTTLAGRRRRASAQV